jgi:uncharacterized membrane protein YfcA
VKANGRLAVSVMMLAIFLFFVGQALAFRPEARAMPLLVGVPAILLCLLQIVIDLKARKAGESAPLLPPEHRPVIAWFLIFLLGIIAFGFTYGAAPLVAAYLYFAARERLIVAVAGGALCLVIVSFLFERLLNVQTFEGLIPGLF